MKRVEPVAALSSCGWRRAGTIATVRRTGRGWIAAAGAEPGAEVQIAQRLEWRDVVAWV
jgi:hypothetical protein